MNKNSNNVSSNPEMTWKLISEITSSKMSSNDDIIKLKNNDYEINVKNDPITVSNMLSNFFTNIAQNNLNIPIISGINHIHKNVSYNDVFLKKIESSDILDIINSFKDDTAAGLNKVSLKIVRHISKFVVHSVAYILSIAQNIFPESLRVADVKPLFKSGDKLSMNNYRPISMLSNFSKIIEKIIKAKLIEFLEKIINNKKPVWL